ncbi:exodeoxyribonuclease VII large subunit [Staphylospora marina]|uniref:exodeoxyribonuclease VII large subunit n=1 Tax=Staphylospora marina TaxID=2490858 RepID=UPI001F14AB4C|nr:exodeoxyribonuclease VII large subunit [Staphylospora marina]
MVGKSGSIWSVCDLVEYLHKRLEDDERLKRIWVEGEISNFTQNSKSRHMYFTLKDGKAAIDAVMFAGNNRRLRFAPKNGDRVFVRGYVSVFISQGKMQLYVQDMRLSGVGELYAAFERLKERLAKEGLFDTPKKSLPPFPKTVGVITSPTGAVIRDIIITMRRRFPLASILLFPVAVQGERAPVEIARAIEVMNRLNEADVLIIGRGGGSIEELWAFNEEVVVREIHRSAIPVISAVGHETDVTISDFVADCRAPTPTAAAEMAVPHLGELQKRIASLQERMVMAMRGRMERLAGRLQTCVDRPVFRKPEARLEQYAQRLDVLQGRLLSGIHRMTDRESRQTRELLHRLRMRDPVLMIKRHKERLKSLQMEALMNIRTQLAEGTQRTVQAAGRLDALSPLKVMSRGYSLVYRMADDELVRTHEQVRPGDLLRIRLARGQLKCQVWKSEGSADE